MASASLLTILRWSSDWRGRDETFIAEVPANEVRKLSFLVHERVKPKADHRVVGEEDAEAAVALVRLVVPRDPEDGLARKMLCIVRST